MKEFFSSLWVFVQSRKFYVALVGAVLQLIPLLIVPTPEWYGVIVAFFTAIGVYSVPNKE